MELGLDILDQTAYSESGLLTGETAAVLGNFQKQTILVGLSYRIQRIQGKHATQRKTLSHLLVQLP